MTLTRPALLLLLPLAALAQPKGPAAVPASPPTAPALADLVNPLMGTDSKPEFSTGNTYPAIARPWGTHAWSPQTGKPGSGWAYQYGANKINGFKQTHQPSPWMNDYGSFALLSGTGRVRVGQEARGSWFSHSTEVARPYYYRVYLADYDVTAELTPTERAARLRFTFPQTDSAWVLVDAADRGSRVEAQTERRRLVGYSSRNSGGVPKNFRNYFVIEFDHDFTLGDVQLTKGDSLLPAATPLPGGRGTGASIETRHAGAVVRFRTRRGEQVQARVASSFISLEQAERNLRELDGQDFEAVKQAGLGEWNQVLGRVEIEGGTDAQRRTFYSCLYRALLFPRRFWEVGADGQPTHYSPYDGQTHAGYLYTDTGFWDTFRALFPLLNLLYPDENLKMQAGLANAYREGGWLPEWASPGYRNIMVGNNSAAVVADAYVKGVRSPDIETLYQAVLKGANAQGPLQAVGRAGAEYYAKLGYVPDDVKIDESAARTLEYAYDDFAIAQLGAALGKPKPEVGLYAARAQNYRKLYDPQHKLMRGRHQNGAWQTPYNPFAWGGVFTEGNGWQYSWSVFHDERGLMKLMGGPRAYAAMLDSVFHLPPVFDDHYYGGVIHEIREMQVADMGQYAHGNQPAQHVIYLYDYCGQPWKTQYWVRETLNRLYRPTPDGYCGDEDNGQTSAWYVFSALGFYPVCPATDQYALGAPLFPKATLHLPGGSQVTLTAPATDATHRYVHMLVVNGQQREANWLSHAELVQGATVDFDMREQPNTQRGTRPEDAPFSVSK